MSKLVFPYGIRFQEDGKLDIFPAAEIVVLGRRGKGIRAMFHLDSGATTSVLPISDAKALSIKIDYNKQIAVRGFSGESVNGYRQTASIMLNGFKIGVPIIFVEGVVPRILGREGVFQRFVIVFDESKRRTGFFDAVRNRKAIDAFFA